MQRLPCLFVLYLLFSACALDGTEGTLDTAPFFDLVGYITAETDRLTAAKTTVKKTITLNGEVETKEITDVNFANDLRVFRQADINKPAWLDKYETDTKELSGNHRITSYLATDSSLIVRRLLIEEDQGVPVKIEIDRKTGNVLSDGTHQLVYEPATGYDVVTKEITRFGEDVDARITVRW